MSARGLRCVLAVTALALGGCASAPTTNTAAAAAAAPAAPRNPADPWEAWNRKVFAFNDALDEAVLLPATTAYRKAVPQLVRTGVDNFLGNLVDVWSTVNHLLQGKLHSGVEMGIRVVTNTVFGLGGLLDPASEMRLPRRPQDFGLTLGHWGFGPGPYMVLPVFGPSTMRDTFGLGLDRAVDPARLPRQPAERWAVVALELVNTRANLLAATQLLQAAALDRYSFARDAYLALRLDAVYDGAPPLAPLDDDPEAPAPTPVPGSSS